MSEYHVPVLFNECLDGLNIKPDGIYIDATFGGGGHSAGILGKLGKNGRLYSFDQDKDAKKNADLIDDNRFTFVNANFRFLQRQMALHQVAEVDGILADLGVSSFQINEPTRGFSTRFDGPLDMRMNQDAETSAFEIVNGYSEKDLHRLLGIYGEVKNAKTTANVICSSRTAKPINTVGELKKILNKLAPRGKENKYFAQIFQAIRIEVNQEMEALKEFLAQTPQVLKNTGRLCVISFHSLEDRLVKNFIRSGKFSGDVNKDFFGNDLKPFEQVSRKAIVATALELSQNGRSRSAKLRVAENVKV